MTLVTLGGDFAEREDYESLGRLALSVITVQSLIPKRAKEIAGTDPSIFEE